MDSMERKRNKVSVVGKVSGLGKPAPTELTYLLKY